MPTTPTRQPPTLSAADYRALQGQKPAPTLPKRPRPASATPAPAEAATAPVLASLRHRPGFGVVAYTDEPGLHRFVGHGLSEAQASALCAEAARLGIPPASMRGFITESRSH